MQVILIFRSLTGDLPRQAGFLFTENIAVFAYLTYSGKELGHLGIRDNSSKKGDLI